MRRCCTAIGCGAAAGLVAGFVLMAAVLLFGPDVNHPF